MKNSSDDAENNEHKDKTESQGEIEEFEVDSNIKEQKCHTPLLMFIHSLISKFWPPSPTSCFGKFWKKTELLRSALLTPPIIALFIGIFFVAAKPVRDALFLRSDFTVLNAFLSTFTGATVPIAMLTIGSLMSQVFRLFFYLFQGSSNAAATQTVFNFSNSC